MPSLLEAHKLSSRAAQAGFDWPNIDGLFDKLHEETEELREELKNSRLPVRARKAAGWPDRGAPGSREPAGAPGRRSRRSFLRAVNIARYLSVDPESALRKTNRKFKRRFQWMEERLHESGRAPMRLHGGTRIAVAKGEGRRSE